ncbi:type II toxin-antitoxin system death-on-curing family toxin [Dactylosporangium sp. NPDC051484]|uniref:type II toxin-antitoxin system death-on-curing family toxin n=1 Tax=Dactylosporangium sp. NPDC051484 TaxID=3154942 RepID=UPI00344EC047
MTLYLGLEDLLYIAQRTLGGEPKVRDIGLLNASSARPQTFVFGYDAYPTLPEKAAALLHSLVCNHALIDGNKRLGFAAMAVFCEINGQALTMSNDDAYELTMGVARGELDVPEIAFALREAGIS